MANVDTGNRGVMILCSSLVMLMTPGLAFFYGGLVSRRNVLAIMMQSFVSMGWTTVIWFVVGYSLCFSGDTGGVLGNLEKAFLICVSVPSPAALKPPTPDVRCVAGHPIFALITPPLIPRDLAPRATL